jgi:pyruvate/2-oxoglutarate dehydrogenase complex dihydrolipoamide dehydrogenase (E3) component
VTTIEKYDAIVIGAGQAGGPLATALAEAGRRTVLIERSHVGGTCINEGCTPTKTMIASSRVAYFARRAADYGVATGSIAVDLARVRQRKRDIVASFRSGSERRIASTAGLEFHLGEARFTESRTIDVALANGQTRRFNGDAIFINTGARPTTPPIPGLDGVVSLDSTSIMELDRVPHHLLVVGGGYVALEFGQLFRRCGSRVTIVQRAGQLLVREDPDVADAVRQILEQDGVEILLRAEVARVEPAPGGQIRATVRTATDEHALTVSHLLCATGRAPETEGLNLASAGIETDPRGHIRVNEQLETTAPGVYALGDVKGGPAFTHISYDDFRIIRTNLLQGGNATTTGRLAPYTIFIDPQLGRVGVTEREARAQGRAVRVARMAMSDVARALEVDETRGFMKAVVDARTDQILGYACLGIEGGELMAMVQLAMVGKLPYRALRDMVFAHPTLAESLNNLFSSFED